MKYQINLLQQKEKSLADKIIYFALHYLRYILVVTQIVVIGVFFYRFKIDQEIIDLKDGLNQKEEIVAVSQSLLDEAKIVDLKLREIKTVFAFQNNFEGMFSYFLSIWPTKATVTRLEIADDSIEFEAVTSDPNYIKLFYNRLKEDNKFRIVNLGSIRRAGAEFYCPFKLKDYIAK